MTSDAPLDSACRLFWPIQPVWPAPHAHGIESAASFTPRRRLISLTSPAPLPKLYFTSPHGPCCRSLPAPSSTPSTENLWLAKRLSIPIHTVTLQLPRLFFTSIYPLIRKFSTSTLVATKPDIPSSLRHVMVSILTRRHVRSQSETRHRYEACRIPVEPR